MSERTQCNYCILEAIKKEMKHEKRKITVERNEINNWVSVFIDDKPSGVSFRELTDHCVC